MFLDLAEVRRLAADLKQAPARLSREATKGVRKTGQEVKRTAKANAPRKTGALAKSIRLRTKGANRGSISTTVISDLRYSAYVEYGTGKGPPQPFLGPALEARESAFAEAMNEACARAMLP